MTDSSTTSKNISPVRDPQPLPAELEAYLYGEEPTPLITPTGPPAAVAPATSIDSTAIIPTASDGRTEELILPSVSQEYEIQDKRDFNKLAIISAVLFFVIAFLATPLALLAMWQIYTKNQRGMWLASIVAVVGILTFMTFAITNPFLTEIVYVEAP